MRRCLLLLTLIMLAGGSSAIGQSGAAKTLDIYYIDAEGGAITMSRKSVCRSKTR